MDVLKGFVFRGEKGDALRAWFQLYPGEIKEHVAAISAAMKLKDAKAPDLSLGEYVAWHGLFIAATVCVQRGHELWDAPKEPRRFRKHPGFVEYMTRNRFDAIKACLLAACCDPSKAATDKWWDGASASPRSTLPGITSRRPSGVVTDTPGLVGSSAGSAIRAGEVTGERGAPAWRAAGDRCIVDRVGRWVFAVLKCRPIL